MLALRVYGEEFIRGGSIRWFQARIRRAPAVWGDAAPDYSAVKLGNAPYRYLYALLFVDDKIVSA